MVGKRADRSSLKSNLVPPAYPPYPANRKSSIWSDVGIEDVVILC